MMQDTVLSICKESVKDFVEYILQFIPTETTILSTADVKNLFPKPEISPEDEVEDSRREE